MDVDQYLSRMGVTRRPAATLEGLTELHRQQFLTVPFENLDIIMGDRIVLNL